MKKPMPPLIRQALQKALALQQGGQLGAAIGAYRNVLALDPQNFDALQLLGLACFQAGDPALAVETLTKALKVNKAYAPAYNNRGLAHQALRNWAEAQRDFSKAIELAPGYAEAYGNRGNVLREMRRTAEAIADHRKALALNSNIPELHNNLGLALGDANQWTAALACFEKALSLRPPYLEALINRANALKEMNRLAEAVAGYDSVLRLKPNHAETLANRGDALRDLRRRDEAAESYRKAIAVKPDHSAAWCGLAQVEAESGRLGAAEENYRQAHRLAPDAVAPLYGIAQAVKFASGDPLIPKFKELLSRHDLTVDDRARLHHAYAKVCNDLRQHDEAFTNFVEGKKLLTGSFDFARHSASYAGMKRLFTTHLLNLLGADSRLASTPLWRTYAPVPNPRAPMNPDGSDPRYTSVAAKWEQQLASNPMSAAMHAMEPDHFHEDVELMGPNFAGYNFEWLHRSPRFRDHYLSHDQTEHYEYMKTVLKIFQWQDVQAGGQRKRFVTKCPQHLEQLPVIRKVFPDATVAITYRDPVEVIQSAITMIAYGERMTYPEIDTQGLLAYWTDRVEKLLRACVRDREFMADDVATVERIYRVAGLPMTDGARARLDAYMAGNPRGRHGRVVYDLRGDFGLDPAALRRRFAFYFDRFAVRAEEDD